MTLKVLFTKGIGYFYDLLIQKVNVRGVGKKYVGINYYNNCPSSPCGDMV